MFVIICKIYFFSNGDIYNGEWLNDTMYGQGKMDFDDTYERARSGERLKAYNRDKLLFTKSKTDRIQASEILLNKMKPLPLGR